MTMMMRTRHFRYPRSRPSTSREEIQWLKLTGRNQSTPLMKVIPMMTKRRGWRRLKQTTRTLTLLGRRGQQLVGQGRVQGQNQGRSRDQNRGRDQAAGVDQAALRAGNHLAAILIEVVLTS